MMKGRPRLAAPTWKVRMLVSIARAIFGTANDRSLKAYQRRVPQINALEPAMEALYHDPHTANRKPAVKLE